MTVNGYEIKPRAKLIGANLIGADLTRSNLRGADLRGADLRGADLTRANLRGSDLRGSDLRDVDLRDVDLRDVDLTRANLIGADLRGADLRGADLSDILISNTTIGILMTCPEEGSFIAYKKVQGAIILKLKIPSSARRSSATTLKCRSDKALVLGAYTEDGYIDDKPLKFMSKYDSDFVYTIGVQVEVPDFDEDRWNECATGIHFFTSKLLAEQY